MGKFGVISQKCKDENYFLTKMEFLKTVNLTMSDELLNYIYSWEKIKKSPYNNCSYYNDVKNWNSFVDGGIRVSDHWNFQKDKKIHCKTKQTDITNDKYWYVGIYDKENDDYDIVKRYDKVENRSKKESNFFIENIRIVSDQIKNEKKPNDDYIEKIRQFKSKLRDGLVKAKVGDDVFTVNKRSHSGFKNKKEFYIEYINGDGEILKTTDYQIVDEILIK